MPIKIYWGPVGSFKSASAVWDEVSRCAREGRLLITNMRGVTVGTCREHIPDCSPAFEVMHLRNDVDEDLWKLRTWWHWAPTGAYFVLDEVQLVYPVSWGKRELAALSNPADRLINGEAFPKTLDLAFDMHRHGNWDFAFTTPNIRKVIPEIRAPAECAYKHKNLAVIGLRGRFLQSQHMAEDNGNPSDVYSQRIRKIPGWVFKVYQSTATGAHRDSKTGLSLLQNPRVLLLAGILVACFALVLSRPTPKLVDASRVENSASGSSVSRSDVVPPARFSRGGQAVGAVGSGRFRLTGVVKLGAMGWAYLWDGAQHRVISASSCVRDRFEGWTCHLGDDVVSMFTGPEPPEFIPVSYPVATLDAVVDSAQKPSPK